MSTHEISRLEVMQRLKEKRLTQNKASEILRISTRQIQRIYRSFVHDGATGIVSKRRGKPSNHQLPAILKQRATAIIQEHYSDFGPTLAQEKLLERHSIKLSTETIRSLMIDAGLWKPRAMRLKRAYQPRYRRDCYGELIQIDGSEHAWFEDRAPKCTLLVYIDDATSKLMELRFVDEESTFSYFQCTQSYITKHGKPVAFYSDRFSVFRVNSKDPKGGDKVTQFGRALGELNIDIICANTCQAKGRVERANKTLQDRLIKEMRLRGISSMEEGNLFVEEFIEAYNRKFGKIPINQTNLHRPLLSHEDLNEVFCWQEERTVSNNLTLQYNKVLYLLEDSVTNRKLMRKRVVVFDYHNGAIKIKHEGRNISYNVLHDRLQDIDQGAIVENKRLGNVLSFIKNKQNELNRKRSKSVPRRTSKLEEKII